MDSNYIDSEKLTHVLILMLTKTCSCIAMNLYWWSQGIGGFLLGVIAPLDLFGGVGTIMAYKGLEGSLQEQSPQTSEDEEDLR